MIITRGYGVKGVMSTAAIITRGFISSYKAEWEDVEKVKTIWEVRKIWEEKK